MVSALKLVVSIILPFITILPLLVFLVLTLPFRLCVYVLAKIFRKDLLCFVQGMAGAYTFDKISKPGCCLNELFVLDGLISLSEFRHLFQERVLSQRNEKGDLIYSRFRQHWTSFCGYKFWKCDRDFNLETHITAVAEEVGNDITEQDLPRVLSPHISKPLPSTNRSPWEILVKNCTFYDDSKMPHKKTLLIFRLHHGLADGLSMINMIQGRLSERERPVFEDMARPTIAKSKTTNNISNPIQYLKLLWAELLSFLTLPYEMSEIIIDSIDTNNSFVFPPTKDSNNTGKPLWPRLVNYSVDYYGSCTRLIEVRDIRELRKQFGVNYVSVMLAAVCGGIRRDLLERKMSVPSKVRFDTPMPKLNHPGGLVNHYYMTSVILPLSDESPQSRLFGIDKQIKRTMKSKVVYVISTWLRMISLLPFCLLALDVNFTRPFIYSNVPVMDQVTRIGGCNVSHFLLMIGHTISRGALMVGMVGDGGKQRVVLAVDKASYPSQQEFENVSKYIEDELRVIKNMKF